MRTSCPGTKDAKGEVLGGTELLRLTAHEGKLFALLGHLAHRTRRNAARRQFYYGTLKEKQ